MRADTCENMQASGPPGSKGKGTPMKCISISTSFALAVLSVALTPASAPAADQGTALEVYVGWMEPGPDLVSPNETFGVRYSNMFSDTVGMQVSVGYFSGEIDGPDVSDPVFDYSFDSETVMLDVGALVEFAPNAAVSPQLVGGLGWAWVNIDSYATAVVPADEVASIDGDSLTLHLGLALQIGLNDTMYVAPGIRGRWFEDRGADDLDIQGSVALGWRF
jgi:hypothetical protein